MPSSSMARQHPDASEPAVKRPKLSSLSSCLAEDTAGAGPAVKNKWECDANEAVVLHLDHDLRLCLQVNIYMHAVSFETYVDIQYEAKVKGGLRKPDDIVDKLKEMMPAGFTQDEAEFAKVLQNSQAGSVLDHGKVISSSKAQDSDTCYEVWSLPLSAAKVRDWYDRVQPLILYYIDGANFIDSSDPHWELVVAIERTVTNGADNTRVVGFCTYHRFYSFPDRSRLRVSQVLILPPFQRQGHAKRLLHAVYEQANRIAAVDVTVEDPSEEFQKLRDIDDYKRLRDHPALTAAADAAVATGAEIMRTRGDASDAEATARVMEAMCLPGALAEDLRRQMKLYKPQLRRVWELLLYVRLRASTEAHEAFRLLILHRLRKEHLSDSRSDLKGKAVRDTKSGFVMLRFRSGTETKQKAEAPVDNDLQESEQKEGTSGDTEQQLEQLFREFKDSLELIRQRAP
eukprot:jgi/Chlat1/7044/Chrsp56S06669